MSICKCVSYKIITLISVGVYKYHQLYFLFNFHFTDCINIIKICTRHVLNVVIRTYVDHVKNICRLELANPLTKQTLLVIG